MKLITKHAKHVTCQVFDSQHFETPFLLYLEKIYLEQIQTSHSTNEVPGNLPIHEVTELQNNTSVFCQGSNMSAIFTGFSG